MRDIKFRAWDKERKRMYTNSKWVEWLVDKNGKLSARNFMILGGGMQRLEVMQYTGLKDKNGVEIYEGDIVDFNGGEICHIVFFMGSFMRENEFGEKGNLNVARIFPNSFFVIGNIYENPELLEV